jgi:hypothetical protein
MENWKLCPCRVQGEEKDRDAEPAARRIVLAIKQPDSGRPGQIALLAAKGVEPPPQNCAPHIREWIANQENEVQSNAFKERNTKVYPRCCHGNEGSTPELMGIEFGMRSPARWSHADIEVAALVTTWAAEMRSTATLRESVILRNIANSNFVKFPIFKGIPLALTLHL